MLKQARLSCSTAPSDELAAGALGQRSIPKSSLAENKTMLTTACTYKEDEVTLPYVLAVQSTQPLA
jgi:hypothetical protein